MFTHELRLAAWPMLISLVITPLRVALELAGVPTVFVFPLGLLWLALGFSVFLGTRLGDEKHPYLLLLLSLVIFSPPSRVPVFVMWWVDTTWPLVRTTATSRVCSRPCSPSCSGVLSFR